MTDMEEKEYKKRLMEYEIEKDFTDKVTDDEFYDLLEETKTADEIKELVKDIKERREKYGRLVRPVHPALNIILKKVEEDLDGQINRDGQEVH